LKQGTILIETAPVKAAVVKKVEESLLDNCSYVGLTPVLNPQYLHSEEYGIAAARADLFQDGIFCIITPPNTNRQAVNFASDLVERLRAKPLFIDLMENDGLMTSTHYFPQLLSIAMLNTILDIPGWGDARKVAGRAFAEVSGPAAHLDEAEALKTAFLTNQDNALRVIDGLIFALREFRGEISNQDHEALKTRITQAKKGINQWWLEKERADWFAVESPEINTPHYHTSLIGNLLGFGLGKRKDKSQGK
jgi:prephenate dehydrogenase